MPEVNIHIQHTLALMRAKYRVNIFSSFLDIRQNVEWPRFFGPPCIRSVCLSVGIGPALTR